MALDPEVAQLVDRQAITDLLSAYCRHFDRNQPDDLAALFTPDAVVDYGPDLPTTTSAQQLHVSVSRGLAEVFAATSHHVTNVEVAFDGPDAADVESALYAWHRYHDGSPDGWLWGRYAHRVVRRQDGWRIRSLRLTAAGSIDFHRQRMHPIGREDVTPAKKRG